MESLYNLAVMVSVVDKLTGPVQKMAQSVQNLDNTIMKAQGMIDFGNKMAVSGALVQGAADKMARSLGDIMAPVKDVHGALGEVASLGLKDIASLQNAAEDFASTWSGTTEAEFISAAYDIKSGISTLSDSAVGDFTKMAALTGKATKATTAEMTSLFATGYGIYKGLYENLSDTEFAEKFSAGIAASVQAFKTTGSGMAQALTTLGGAASSAQRPLEEQLAVVGMLQATMPGGEAGTKYKAFVQNAARAGESLGLSFVDSNNQLLGMVDILDKMRGKYGETLDAMEKQEIQKAFGTVEAVSLIDLMYPKVDQLKSSITGLGEATAQGTVFTEGMAAAMNKDLGAQMQLVGQNIDILKRSIGEEIAPLLVDLIPNIRDLVQGFQGFTQAHPTITRTALLLFALGTAALAVLAPILSIGAGAVMMGGYTLRAGASIVRALKLVGLAGGSLLRFLTMLPYAGMSVARVLLSVAYYVGSFAKAAIFAGARALPGLIASVWSFTAALLANPITWIVLALVALGVAIYALWRNWDIVTAALGAGCDWIKDKFAAAKEWFGGLFQGIIDAVIMYGPMVLAAIFPFLGVPLLIWQHWDQIKEYVRNAINNAIQCISGFNLFESGKALIQTFISGIKSLIDQPAEIVKGGLAKLRNLLPFSDAKEGPLSTLTLSGQRLIETFAGGILSRSGYLKAAAAVAVAGISLAMPVGAWAAAPPPVLEPQQVVITPVLGDVPDVPVPGGTDRTGSWDIPPLDHTPAVNLREVIKEVSHERETTQTRDRRPIVVVVKGGEKQGDNFESYIDMALRYLEMRGGD